MNKGLKPLVWAGLQVFKLFSSFVVTIMVMEVIHKIKEFIL